MNQTWSGAICHLGCLTTSHIFGNQHSTIYTCLIYCTSPKKDAPNAIKTKTTDITLLLGVFVITAFELKQIPFAKSISVTTMHKQRRTLLPWDSITNYSTALINLHSFSKNEHLILTPFHIFT